MTAKCFLLPCNTQKNHPGFSLQQKISKQIYKRSIQPDVCLLKMFANLLLFLSLRLIFNYL